MTFEDALENVVFNIVNVSCPHPSSLPTYSFMTVLSCRQYCGRVPGAVQGAGPQGGVRQEGEAAEHAEGARGGRGPRDQGFLHKVREDQETVRILPFKGKRQTGN